MQVYSKAFASIEEVAEKDYGPNGGFTAILSTPSEDRDGDELFQEEWKDFTFDRYPLDMDHGMSVAETVGSFTPYFDGQKMMMDAYFSSIPRAQEVRTLVDEGHIRTVSVAFMVDKTKKSGEKKRELLNAGIVAIPSNRDAVILASKAASALKDAFSDATEGDVPDEVKKAVLDALGVKEAAAPKDSEGEAKAAVYVDVLPRIDMDQWEKSINEAVTKAGATASGIGSDGALVQAIHDASSHLGAACPVIEVADPGTGASDGANKSTDDVETKDVDAHQVVAGLDAIIDEAVDLSATADRSTLPEPVGQALDLLVGAKEAVASLMEMLGIFDPDGDKSVDPAEAFAKALDEVLTPDESPAEAAAASDKEPAPADDAAETKKAQRERTAQRYELLARTKINS
ncbi:hypothetical protein DQP57_00335 [Mycobacterium colombiense]|uniref:Uncharacterized protein n=1 Tax=Mycobacterium colombiense TaxID=339268 RepID=A0A329MIT0_9MYCO|nr:hypothetical protein [Mycobacterium colombiense]RAV17507.1 hypothetical protein DQP57_00335 [Mycobacterium colombiense]